MNLDPGLLRSKVANRGVQSAKEGYEGSPTLTVTEELRKEIKESGAKCGPSRVFYSEYAIRLALLTYDTGTSLDAQFVGIGRNLTGMDEPDSSPVAEYNHNPAIADLQARVAHLESLIERRNPDVPVDRRVLPATKHAVQSPTRSSGIPTRL
jgi:hypothetical protein